MRLSARAIRAKREQAFQGAALTACAQAVWFGMAGKDRQIVLGIETSCDETAAAVVERRVDGSGLALGGASRGPSGGAAGGDARGRILSNVVRSQWEAHRPFGGVVPEIAARAHVECLDVIIAEAMKTAGVGFADLDGVAVTAGPGLVGGVMVGVITAEAIAQVHGLPLLAVNHLAAHALTVGLTDGLRPPYLMLLVSGGHTQVLVIEDVDRFRRISTTIDDALGEAFDKTAKLLGLGFPGGPAVERAARSGDGARFSFPRPMTGREEPHFSFAGLKTAVRVQAQKLAPLTDQDVADLCASFQAAVAGSVADRVRRAMRIVGGEDDVAAAPHPAADQVRGHHLAVHGERERIRHLVVAGGVAANMALRAALGDVAAEEGYALVVPPIGLCTDNGAMIAWAGAERLARGLVDAPGIVARARWPLDETAATVLGSGRLGGKA